MSQTALLIGGPRDGEVMTACGDEYRIAIAELPEITAKWLTEQESFSSLPVVKTRYYMKRRVNVFGQVLSLWVYELLPKELWDLAAAKHLLSPLALRLIEEEG